ncbi:hypothetical protein CYY_009325 [Polysphondylium violaceum]|uniref:Nodulin-like domain-containing protein n=1 Tax=Polysphondylium violaceum TaxID=133409 RepID=A0A8J4PLN2_9MYCE|nr:hypothetical protein CYY_009325 [Polysphondylium violaceum]
MIQNDNNSSTEDLVNASNSSTSTFNSSVDFDDSSMNSKPTKTATEDPAFEYDEKDIELQSINNHNNNKNNDQDSSHELKKFYGPPHPLRDNEKAMKYTSLAWGAVTILISGTLYGFSLISHEIKEKLDYSQSDISEAISIGDIGIYLGASGGYFYDRLGPFYTCLLAAVLYTIGYMGCWGVVSKRLSTQSPLLLAFFLFLVGQASHATFTAAIVSNVHNFSLKHRAKLSGLLVGCFALSSGIFGIIYKSTFKKSKNVEGYLMFLAILLTSVTLIGSYVLRYIGHEDDKQTKRVKKTNDSSLSQSSQSIQEQHTNNDTSNINEKESPKTKREVGDEEEEDDNDQQDQHREVKLQSSSSSTKTSEGEGILSIHDQSNIDPFSGPNYLDGKRDISGLKLWTNIEYIITFINYFFVAGGSLMFLNNISSIVASLELNDSYSSDLVIIFSVCNLSGRVGFGLLSDFISKKYSRFFLLSFCSMTLSIVLLLFAIFMKKFFLVACVLVPIVYGGTVSLMASLISLRFGSRRFGLNFGFLNFSSASGSLVFGELSGHIYDSFANEKHNCYGEKCFRSSFLISFSCIFACTFLTLSLVYILNQRRQKAMAEIINNNINNNINNASGSGNNNTNGNSSTSDDIPIQ